MHFWPNRILLVNSWIYDFVAYDFWAKPLGLLMLGTILRAHGYEIDLLDCQDRHHPQLSRYLGGKKCNLKGDGTGKFLREEIEKPAVYRQIPRKYCRYGFPPVVVEQLLENLPSAPRAILLTSLMTFWYPALVDMVQLLRKHFPQSPIILGGVYATLCPDHAQREIRPDFLVTGEGEEQIIPLLNEICGYNSKARDEYSDSIPYDLYPTLNSIAVITSRGCPNHCSFCASRRLSPVYRRRPYRDVLREIGKWHAEKNIEHVCFYDDALLYHSARHIKPFLRTLASLGLQVQLHAPNGLQPRYIDEEMAQLFFDANFKTIRLSYETSNAIRQRAMSSKVNNDDLEQALKNLESAGYKREKIVVYLLMGLADQNIEEVKESVMFVRSLGAKTSIASFSPIPGTIEWQNSLRFGFWNEHDDLLLTNPSVFPVWSRKLGYQKSQNLLNWAKRQNS